MDYIFGKTKYKNKKEAEEAARADMNKQVNEDGNVIYSRQATMNDKSLDSLRSELMNAPDDPNADQIIYYGRVDNPDGTYSYKIGLAGVDTFGRTAEEARGKDITYLWAKRTKDAAKYEALFHGNRTLVRDRRNDLGMDPEGYGAGHTEIYNSDFLGLDGTVSMDKIETLNISTQSKLQSMGINVTGRYDAKGMESGYKALEKAERIYGVDSKEAKELSFLMSNMEQKGKRTRSLISAPIDLAQGFASSAQQMVLGIADTVVDAIDPFGNNSLLDKVKSAEVADKFWGYEGRKEAEVLGRQALQQWDKGNYVGALLKGIQAAPDTVAQSLPDMGLMFMSLGGGTAIKAAQLAKAGIIDAAKLEAKTAAIAAGKTGLQVEEAVKAASISVATRKAAKEASELAVKQFEAGKALRYFNPNANRGLGVFAAKQTNNQIDERIQNGDTDVNLATIGAMFASNYVLGGIDKIAFGEQFKVKPIIDMMKAIPEKGMIGVAKKAAATAATLVKAGSIEAAQEFTQSYGEAINAGLGTERYGNNPFSKHFLDQATQGALLGFGAGGLMHGGAMIGSAAGITLEKRKKKAAAQEDKPLSSLGNTAFAEASGYNTQSEMEEILNKDGIDTKESFDDHIDKALELATNDSVESINSIIENMIKIGKDKGFYTEDDVKAIEAKVYDISNPHIKELKVITGENTDKSLDVESAKETFRSIVQRSGAHLKEMVNSIQKQVEEGSLDAEKVVSFVTEELLDLDFSSRPVMYKSNISLLSKSLGILSSNANTVIDEVIDNQERGSKETEEAIETISKKFKSKEDDINEMDFSDFDGNLEDIIHTEDKQGRGVLSAIQRILAVTGKANEEIGDKNLVPNIAKYLSKLSKDTVDSYKQGLIDHLTGVSHFSLLKKVSYAFKEMSEAQIEEFLNYQTELLETTLLQQDYGENTTKTTENVSYDIITSGNKYGKPSLQEYLHNALTALAFEDKGKRTKYLNNLIENLGFWVKTEGTLATTEKLGKVINEEARLKLELLNLLHNLRDGTTSKDTIDYQKVLESIATPENTKSTENKESTNEYNDTMKKALKKILSQNSDLVQTLENEHGINLEDC